MPPDLGCTTTWRTVLEMTGASSQNNNKNTVLIEPLYMGDKQLKTLRMYLSTEGNANFYSQLCTAIFS